LSWLGIALAALVLIGAGGLTLLARKLLLSKVPLVEKILPSVAIPLPAIRGTLSDPKPEADWGPFWKTLLSNLPGARRLWDGVKDLGKKLPAIR